VPLGAVADHLPLVLSVVLKQDFRGGEDLRAGLVGEKGDVELASADECLGEALAGRPAALLDAGRPQRLAAVRHHHRILVQPHRGVLPDALDDVRAGGDRAIRRQVGERVPVGGRHAVGAEEFLGKDLVGGNEERLGA